jgi:excisionase family DNA binding protein
MRAKLGELGNGGLMSAVDAQDLLTPAEVAALFRVNAKTVSRWARAGKIATARTLGGHRRYRRAEIEALVVGVGDRG